MFCQRGTELFVLKLAKVDLGPKTQICIFVLGGSLHKCKWHEAEKVVSPTYPKEDTASWKLVLEVEQCMRIGGALAAYHVYKQKSIPESTECTRTTLPVSPPPQPPYPTPSLPPQPSKPFRKEYCEKLPPKMSSLMKKVTHRELWSLQLFSMWNEVDRAISSVNWRTCQLLCS